MKTFYSHVNLNTNKQFELIDITAHVEHAVASSGVSNGSVVIFNPHTTASVRLNHNEPLLMQDILKALYRLAPVDVNYSHDLFELRQKVAPNERSNGHAHVKSFFFGSSETLIIQNGSLLMGEKQSIFFVEFDGGRHRDIHIQVMGE